MCTVVYTHRQVPSQDFRCGLQTQTAEFNFLWVGSSPCLTDNKGCYLTNPFSWTLSAKKQVTFFLLTCVCGSNALRRLSKPSFENMQRSPDSKKHWIEFKTGHIQNTYETVSQVPSYFKIPRYCKILH